MASPAKIGAFALIGSCVAAGCAGGIYLTSGTPIKEIISKEDEYILLDTTEGARNKDTTKWGEVWKSYKADGKNVFNLAGWKSDNSYFDLTEALKKKCSELSGSKVLSKESGFYTDVTKYCARGVTFAEQAEKEGLTVLDTSGATHANVWRNRHRDRTSMTTHFTKLGIADNPNGNDIKAGCGKAKEKNKQVKDYSNIYASFKEVCIKKEGDPNS